MIDVEGFRSLVAQGRSAQLDELCVGLLQGALRSPTQVPAALDVTRRLLGAPMLGRDAPRWIVRIALIEAVLRRALRAVRGREALIRHALAHDAPLVAEALALGAIDPQERAPLLALCAQGRTRRDVRLARAIAWNEARLEERAPRRLGKPRVAATPTLEELLAQEERRRRPVPLLRALARATPAQIQEARSKLAKLHGDEAKPRPSAEVELVFSLRAGTSPGRSVHVWSTRPERQAEGLARLLLELGPGAHLHAWRELRNELPADAALDRVRAAFDWLRGEHPSTPAPTALRQLLADVVPHVVDEASEERLRQLLAELRTLDAEERRTALLPMILEARHRRAIHALFEEAFVALGERDDQAELLALASLQLRLVELGHAPDELASGALPVLLALVAADASAGPSLARRWLALGLRPSAAAAREPEFPERWERFLSRAEQPEPVLEPDEETFVPRAHFEAGARHIREAPAEAEDRLRNFLSTSTGYGVNYVYGLLEAIADGPLGRSIARALALDLLELQLTVGRANAGRAGGEIPRAALAAVNARRALFVRRESGDLRAALELATREFEEERVERALRLVRELSGDDSSGEAEGLECRCLDRLGRELPELPARVARLAAKRGDPRLGLRAVLLHLEQLLPPPEEERSPEAEAVRCFVAWLENDAQEERRSAAAELPTQLSGLLHALRDGKAPEKQDWHALARKAHLCPPGARSKLKRRLPPGVVARLADVFDGHPGPATPFRAAFEQLTRVRRCSNPAELRSLVEGLPLLHPGPARVVIELAIADPKRRLVATEAARLAATSDAATTLSLERVAAEPDEEGSLTLALEALFRRLETGLGWDDDAARHAAGIVATRGLAPLVARLGRCTSELRARCFEELAALPAFGFAPSREWAPLQQLLLAERRPWLAVAIAEERWRAGALSQEGLDQAIEEARQAWTKQKQLLRDARLVRFHAHAVDGLRNFPKRWLRASLGDVERLSQSAEDREHWLIPKRNSSFFTVGEGRGPTRLLVHDGPTSFDVVAAFYEEHALYEKHLDDPAFTPAAVERGPWHSLHEARTLLGEAP